MINQNLDYLCTILLRAIIAIRNNATQEKANELTDNLLTHSDWHMLARDMEDALEQSNVNYDLIEQQLIHFLNTDNYWMLWADRVGNQR